MTLDEFLDALCDHPETGIIRQEEWDRLHGDHTEVGRG